jgi:hypothetical protein
MPISIENSTPTRSPRSGRISRSAFAFEERLMVVVRDGLREEVPQAVVDRLRSALRSEIL